MGDSRRGRLAGSLSSLVELSKVSVLLSSASPSLLASPVEQARGDSLSFSEDGLSF